jgi:hypothetical protein
MKSVWIVEKNVYSDYHVVGIFSSRANAQLVADRINDSEEDTSYKATIAKRPLNPSVAELHAGLLFYLVTMRFDGTVERCDLRDLNTYMPQGEARVWRRSKAPFYKEKNIPDVLLIEVWATDPTHAVKIANERRAAMKAANQLIEGDTK